MAKNPTVKKLKREGLSNLILANKWSSVETLINAGVQPSEDDLLLAIGETTPIDMQPIELVANKMAGLPDVKELFKRVVKRAEKKYGRRLFVVRKFLTRIAEEAHPMPPEPTGTPVNTPIVTLG